MPRAVVGPEKKRQFPAIQVTIFLCFSSLGGFLSLKLGGNKQGSTITSPLLDGKEWKCMRFWYRIGLGHGADLKVLMSTSNITQQVWRTSHRTSNWSFVQLSINTNEMARVMINNVLKLKLSFPPKSAGENAKQVCVRAAMHAVSR